MEDLSFIVLINFRYGIGTDKKFSSQVMKEMKNIQCFIDKCSSRETVPVIESENGCTEHKYVARITTDGLRTLLFDYIYPDSMCCSMSLTLEYGTCDAIVFNSTQHECYPDDDMAYKTIRAMHKKATGESLSLFSREWPYRYQVAKGMVGYTDHSVYVTPVKRTTNGYVLHDEAFDFFETLMKCPYTDWESEFDDFFGTMKNHMSLEEIEEALNKLKNSK